MRTNSIILPLLLSILLFSVSCGNEKKQAEKKIEKKGFSLPDIPAVIQSQKDRSIYTVVHYWEKFDFTDTTLISKDDITEQAFVDFIYILPNIDKKYAQDALYNMMQGAAKNNDMFLHFAKESEKYLYDPNSPYLNEDMYITVLQQIIANPKLSEEDKVKPKYQLEQVMKNRVGDIAPSFPELKRAKGNHIILFFFNPDCPDCKRVKQYITDNKIDQLATIVAVNPDENEKVESLYTPRAIPCLYLLDGEKRILIKDAKIESIHSALQQAN